MTDLSERVERACAAMRGEAAWSERVAAHAMMANLDRAAVLDGLRAAFPELFSSPPSHWLAPMEAPEVMTKARGMRGHLRARADYADMRDAYLKGQS